MDIREFWALLEAVSQLDLSTGKHAPIASMARELRAELIGVIEDVTGESVGALVYDRLPRDPGTPWGLDVEHVLRVGIEETRKAHGQVAALRRRAEANRAQVEHRRDTILATCVAQVNTIPEVRALARGEMLDGSPLRGNAGEAVLRRLAENIANNVAGYVRLDSEDDVSGASANLGGE